jgi:hypothetical protein
MATAVDDRHRQVARNHERQRENARDVDRIPPCDDPVHETVVVVAGYADSSARARRRAGADREVALNPAG